MLLGYSDSELASMGGYDLVHYDDLAYVASAHQECKKNRFILIKTLSYYSIFHSIENWSIWNDCVSISNQRWSMAMVAN